MNKYKITILTVVRNGVTHLSQTIESVLNQNYYPIEYIIIDGVSLDGSLELIKEFERRINNGEYENFVSETSKGIDHRVSETKSTYRWLSESDLGMYDAINKGIDLANGEYIGLLHADDWLETDACQILSNEINSDDMSVGMYYGMIRIFSSNGIHLETYGGTMSNLSSRMIAHTSCFVRRDVYLDGNKYSLGYKSAADYELILKFVEINLDTKFVEKVFSNFRLGGISGSHLGSLETISLQYKYKKIPLWNFTLKHIYIRLLILKNISMFQ